MKFLSYIILAMFAVFITHAQDFPKPTGYVNDYAKVFTEEDRLILEKNISDYEKNTSIEIAVVVINDIQQTVLEEYATELFNTWGIGKKQNDAGLLILLSLDTFDRGLRIEVGYGLEEFITDYQASEIIEEVMPLLKSGDYAKALVISVRTSIAKIGTRTAEAREQYLNGLQKERDEQTAQFLMGLIIIGGIVIIFFVIFIIYRKLKAREKRLEQEKQYKNITFSNLTSLQLVYDDTIKAIELLDTKQFYGADEALRQLKRRDNLIKKEFSDNLTKSKKHEDVIKIASDIDIISDELRDVSKEIFENHNIENNIRNRLETQIDDMKRQVQNALPQARQVIGLINKDNPESIWRNFDYKNLDRNVDAFFNKSDQMVKTALNNLDSHLYKDAKFSATSAVTYINNAITSVSSIFDVNHQINNGKEKYNQQISRLPNLISSTEKALQRSNVKSSTKASISSIGSDYKELQSEVNKGPNKIDWIIVGALIVSILNSCDSSVRQSSRDMSDYEEEIASQKRRKREREEESQRSYHSSNSGGSFGGFGGGGSGGGGASGRF